MKECEKATEGQGSKTDNITRGMMRNTFEPKMLLSLISLSARTHERRQRGVMNVLYSKQSPQSSPIKLILSNKQARARDKGMKAGKHTEVNGRGST